MLWAWRRWGRCWSGGAWTRLRCGGGCTERQRPGSGKGGTRYGYWRKVGRLRRWPMCWNEMPIPLANGQRRSRSADRRRWFLTRCPASTIFADWRQSVLPVHLLGLAALLSSVGPVTGDVKLQDDGVVHDPVDCRSGGHGVGKNASHSEKTRFDVMPKDRRS